MKIYIIIFFGICTIICNGQSNVYHPFPDSNAVWTENDARWSETSVCPNQNSNPLVDEDHLTYQIKKDTIINSLTYHKIIKTGTRHTHCWDGFNMNSYSTFNYYEGAIRQDIPTKKVYLVPNSASSEILLYDFNLIIGSAVECVTVMAIDSVLIGNSYHKRFGFSTPAAGYLIEGIGYTSGLLEPLCPGEESSNLICFSKNGQTLYPNANATCLIITNNKENVKLRSYALFPNPNSGSFKVKLDFELDKAIIIITNYLGQTIHQQNIVSGENNINLIDVSHGFYTYLILSDKEVLSSGKISVK